MPTPVELAASLRQRDVKKKKAVSVSFSANDGDDYEDGEVEQSGDSDGAAILTLHKMSTIADIGDRDQKHTQAWSKKGNNGK